MSKFPIRIKKSQIEHLCKNYHIKYLAFFGSILTSNFTKRSDVDILVKFDKKHIPHLLDMIRIESELSEIIGYRVDLKTPNDLSPYFREEVITQAKTIYGK